MERNNVLTSRQKCFSSPFVHRFLDCCRKRELSRIWISWILMFSTGCHLRQIPFLSSPKTRQFPFLSKKGRRRGSYQRFQYLAHSFSYVLAAHARSFISWFNFRWTGVTLDRPRKLLTPAGRCGRRWGRKSGPSTEKSSSIRPERRAEPDVHLIIIAPNESHSLTVLPLHPPFVMDFCGQLRQSLLLLPSPSASSHFRLHASAFCCTLSNRCCDSRKPTCALRFLEINLGISTKLETLGSSVFLFFSLR